MQDSTQMTQAPATPQPSIPSSAVASPAGYPQAQAPIAQASYPTATAAAAPSPAYQQPVAPQVNPWQEAFNRLSESLSATPSYQPQAPSWPMTQQVAPSPVAYPSAPVSYQAAPVSYQAAPSTSALLTSPYQQTQAYSPATMPQAMPSSAVQSAPSSDEYLQNVSSESLEVLQHFGAEAPALLNRYACVVEDALLNQAQQTATALQHLGQLEQKLSGAHAVITNAAEDNAAYHTLLTDPDLLADYVNEFYGPQGPYPTETSRDRLAAEVAAADPYFEQQAPRYQRPQMEMPAPNVQASSGADDFWATFSQISERNPAAAWQLLSQATPDALRSKVLVSEG